MRTVWVLFGLLSVALGVIGVFLPILPTVPFLLLATYSFARSSQSLHDWLVSHPKLGPPIKDWNQRGAIGRKAKVLASISVAMTLALSFFLEVNVSIMFIQSTILCVVLLFIWTRPEK